MRFWSCCASLLLGIACVAASHAAIRRIGQPTMFVALNPMAEAGQVAASFANASSEPRSLDFKGMEYFLYTPADAPDTYYIHIHQKPYLGNTAERLTREARAVSVQPREMANVMDVTPLLQQLPAKKAATLFAIHHPAPDYDGTVLWNGFLRSASLPWKGR